MAYVLLDGHVVISIAMWQNRPLPFSYTTLLQSQGRSLKGLSKAL
mgnify:CR=1 FL=1